MSKSYHYPKIVMPGDLNGASTLFGGRALAWIDEATAIYAMSMLKKTNLVTKVMGKVDFIAPAHQNDILEIGVEITRVGRTSVTLDCELRNLTTQKVMVAVEGIVFVAVGKDGRPEPHGYEEDIGAVS